MKHLLVGLDRRDEFDDIIDVRTPLEYADDHIPGALNRPFGESVTGDGRFKPADVLRAEWCAIAKARDPATLVMQCGSGVTACHNLLALELAGLSGARLYPGSWSEWCADPLRPVATGAESTPRS